MHFMHICVYLYFVFIITCMCLASTAKIWVEYMHFQHRIILYSGLVKPSLCLEVFYLSFSIILNCKCLLLVIPAYLGLDKRLCLQGLWSGSLGCRAWLCV